MSKVDTLDQSRFKYLPNYDLLKGGNAIRTYYAILQNGDYFGMVKGSI